MVDVILVAGGTGGHLFPAVATIEELITKNISYKLITDNRCVHYVADSNLDYQVFQLKSLSGSIFSKLKWCIHALIVLFRLICFYIHLKPKLIVGFGGYPSFLPLLAARILRIKVVIHEQNIFLGKANAFFQSYAKFLATSFNKTLNIASKYSNKIINTGNPVRKRFFDIAKKPEDFHVIENFCILILGGSQGAQIFTKIMPQILPLVKNYHKIKIIQQARKEDIASLQEQYQKIGVEYDVSDFFTNIVDLYSCAHLVIARAGASTISELITIKQPNILVPLPSSTQDHQKLAAEFMETNQASFCVLEQNNIVEKIAMHINAIMQDKAIMVKQHNNLSALNIKNAAENLSNLIINTI